MVKRLTLKQVEKIVGWPVRTWPGECSSIAKGLQAETGAEYCYGNWTGPIAPTYVLNGKRTPSMFADKPVCHHAWLELKGGVIDPTRWVFEGVEPYIYYGPSDYYDYGGNILRDSMLGAPPDPYESSREWKHPNFGDATDRVRELLRHPIKDGCSMEQLFWLANCSPQRIGEFYVAEIYEALVDVGMGAAIPYDSQERYLK